MPKQKENHNGYEYRGKSFAPVFSVASRALILGSYPSPQSFARGYNYGHPQNRFWPLLARLCGAPPPTTIPERKALILQNGLALWDALESCRIIGASDASIADAHPNDIPGLVAKTRIEAVFCNGEAAYRYYRKYSEKAVGIEAVKLPSTSPANARYRMEDLLEAWQDVKEYISST